MLDSSLLQIGSRRQFFFDNLVIDTVQDLTRRHHCPEKHGDGPLLRKDRPWEKMLYFTCNTWNVIHDPRDGLFKCWYENWLLEDTADIPALFRETDKKLIVDPHGGGTPSCVCFAQSEDGINWEKPELDLVVEDGRKTNIVLGKGVCGDLAHCAYVFLDPFEQDESRRFKVMFEYGVHSAIEGTTGTGHFAVAASGDGIHWEVLPGRLMYGGKEAYLGDVVTISPDPSSRSYWSNNRHPGMGTIPFDPACPPTASWISPCGPSNFAKENRRRVFRSESADLIHWSYPYPLVVPDDDLDNLDDCFYGMEQFQIGDDWLGLLNVFHMTDNTMDVQLVHSRDGRDFTRVRPGQPWLSNGGGKSWNAFMVSICSKPINVGDELYVYHGGQNSHHDWWFVGPAEGLDCPEAKDLGKVAHGLGLARMKRDRFVSLGTGPVREGVLITRALRTEGSELVVNAACEDQGSLVAELTDASGKVIDGFEKENCIAFDGDAVAHTIRWKAGKPIPSGDFVRVRFAMRKADLFTFEFV